MSDADLDNKLREILANMRSDQVDDLDLPAVFQQDRYAPAIAEIKQAFADEGYIRIQPTLDELQQKTLEEYPNKLMTGQEWLLAVQREIGAEGRTPDDTITFGELTEAAKRAAGLTDN